MESEKVNVSVLIPVRNEEKYIEQCILSLMKQDFPKENLEIILIDGNSEDGTAKIINKYMELQPGLIRLLSNPNLTVPYAMNIGIKASKGKYVIRIDAHSDYAKDYISKCVYYLENIDADNVGGPMVAKGKDNLQKIIAASYHSKFALGGGKFHDENYEGYADTVYLGAYKKDALVNIGMYDEKFTRNQDDELNYRLIKNGGKIFITPNIKSLYFPRNNYKKLIKQYFEYGFWKVEVIKKHGVPARITHLVPACFVVFLIFGIAASLLFKPAAFVFLTIIALYLVMNLYFSFTSKHIKGLRNKLRLMLVHFILHSSYGIGFIRGLLHFLKAADWLRSLKLWKMVNKRFTRKKESE